MLPTAKHHICHFCSSQDLGKFLHHTKKCKSRPNVLWSNDKFLHTTLLSFVIWVQNLLSLLAIFSHEDFSPWTMSAAFATKYDECRLKCRLNQLIIIISSSWEKLCEKADVWLMLKSREEELAWICNTLKTILDKPPPSHHHHHHTLPKHDNKGPFWCQY